MHNTDIWWNMVIKFTKQIGITFANIINRKVNSKPCQTADIGFFRKSLLASEANLESCHRSKIQLLRFKSFIIFARISILNVWNHHHFFIQIPILGHILVRSVHKTHVLYLTKILLNRTTLRGQTLS